MAIENGNKFVMDVNGAGNTNWTNVQLYEFNGTDAQKWKLVRAETFTSALTINMASYPDGSLNKGESYPIKGTISSDCKLSLITVALVDAYGKEVLKYTVKPYCTSYKLYNSALNKWLTFDTLEVGEYYLWYWAEDVSGNFRVWLSNYFQIVDPLAVFNGEITTAMIDEVLDKYGYTNGSYWTVLSSRTYPNFTNCAYTNYVKGNCPASPYKAGTKGSNGQNYMSY